MGRTQSSTRVCVRVKVGDRELLRSCQVKESVFRLPIVQRDFVRTSSGLFTPSPIEPCGDAAFPSTGRVSVTVDGLAVVISGVVYSTNRSVRLRRSPIDCRAMSARSLIPSGGAGCGSKPHPASRVPSAGRASNLAEEAQGLRPEIRAPPLSQAKMRPSQSPRFMFSLLVFSIGPRSRPAVRHRKNAN